MTGPIYDKHFPLRCYSTWFSVLNLQFSLFSSVYSRYFSFTLYVDVVQYHFHFVM